MCMPAIQIQNWKQNNLLMSKNNKIQQQRLRKKKKSKYIMEMNICEEKCVFTSHISK